MHCEQVAHSVQVLNCAFLPALFSFHSCPAVHIDPHTSFKLFAPFVIVDR